MNRLRVTILNENNEQQNLIFFVQRGVTIHEAIEDIKEEQPNLNIQSYKFIV